MKLAIDTHYFEEFAITAGIGFEEWKSDIECSRYRVKYRITGEYIPGEFYKRELPGVLSLLKDVPWSPEITIIDGYVTLGEGRIGLDGHLFNALGGKFPMFITSLGIEVADASACIASMAGRYWIPTILKAADSLARGQTTL